MKKHRFSFHIKITGVILVTLVFIILSFLGSYILDMRIQDALTFNYISQQKDIVDREVRHIKEAYEKNKKIDIDNMMVSYIQEENNSVNNYWFVYTQEHVLFERDAMQTALLEDKGMDQLLSEWQEKGGKDVAQIETLFQGKADYAIASKEEYADAEIINAQRFELNGKQYVVGNAVNQATLFKTDNYPITRIAFFALVGGLGLVILVLGLRLAIVMRRLHKSRDENERQVDKTEVARLEQEVKERRRQVKEYQLMDPLMLYYNREYFYTLLLNMTRQNLKSLGMIVIELAPLHDVIKEHGMEYEQNVFTDLKKVLTDTLQTEHMIARTRENRIVITVLNDDYRLMSEECGALEKQIQRLDLVIEVTLYSVIQMPNETPMDMYKRIDRIISMK